MRRLLSAIAVGVATIVSVGLAAQVVQNRQVRGKIVMQKTKLKPGDPLPKQLARKPTDTWTDLIFLDVKDGQINKCPKPGVLAVSAMADLNTPPLRPPPWNLPAFSYYWTLTVRRPAPVEGQPHKMETVSYHEYKDQVFEASHGTHITPKFGEQLKLTPGRYLVSVGLVEVLWKNGALRSSNADGSLSGPLRSYWAEVR